MLYAIQIYGEPGVYEALPAAKQDEVMSGHRALQEALRGRGDFISAKLMPPAILGREATLSQCLDSPDADAEANVKDWYSGPAAQAEPLIVDGPFAETKESFLGFYAAEFADLEDALAHARMISSPVARIEVRPVEWAGGMLSQG